MVNTSQNEVGLVPLPFVTVTLTGPGLCEGTSARITESKTATNGVEVWPNCTEVASPKLLPKMITSEPGRPLFGNRNVTDGA